MVTGTMSTKKYSSNDERSIKIHGRMRKRRMKIVTLVMMMVMFVSVCCISPTEAVKTSKKKKEEVFSFFSWQSLWEYEDGDDGTVSTLNMLEISDMRVRDIKRRLSRHHGYGADELSRMLDKRELINALSYEEHKTQQQQEEKTRRILFKRSIIVALLCVLIVICKPLLIQVYDVISVNIVVYTDKKRYEFSKCRDYSSIKASLGVIAMMTVDLAKLWLSSSVLLSWVLPSNSLYRQYLFPVPSIPIKPAQMLAVASGKPGNAAGPLGNYGINIGPMVRHTISHIYHK